MLVIYHSRDYLPARQAAAMHTGVIPPEPPADMRAVRGALQADGALTATGLWSAGTAPGGHRIFAVGRASRPDVTYRAFHAIADLMGVEPRTFLLQHVGGRIAWTQLAVTVLRRLGLSRLALLVEMHSLRRHWAGARMAVAEANRRLRASP